ASVIAAFFCNAVQQTKAAFAAFSTSDIRRLLNIRRRGKVTVLSHTRRIQHAIFREKSVFRLPSSR
ncbi:hypothetical protein, partial [Klebsiella quasipneumoniae]|uniref:hypothetical protein n=1 Tax=Klebsiella quasipneumoniae TaxID=1463165 RepID=UPI001966F144